MQLKDTQLLRQQAYIDGQWCDAADGRTLARAIRIAGQTDNNLQHHQAEMEQMLTAVQEMSYVSQEVATHANNTADSAKQAQGAADQGKVRFQQVIQSMHKVAAEAGKGAEVVEGLARQYLAIRIWGAPATIAVYALTGWLVGMERTRGVLWLQLVQNGLNVVLCLWFVMGLGWGVPGVATATLIAGATDVGLWVTKALRDLTEKG